jgi:hypothetical protein
MNFKNNIQHIPTILVIFHEGSNIDLKGYNDVERALISPLHTVTPKKDFVLPDPKAEEFITLHYSTTMDYYVFNYTEYMEQKIIQILFTLTTAAFYCQIHKNYNEKQKSLILHVPTGTLLDWNEFIIAKEAKEFAMMYSGQGSKLKIDEKTKNINLSQAALECEKWCFITDTIGGSASIIHLPSNMTIHRWQDYLPERNSVI